MYTRPIEVLLVEDNPADARLLAESLKEPGAGEFRVTRVARLQEALDALARSPVDVILLDLSLPDSAGLATVDRVRAAAPGTPVVVLTGLQDEALALEAVRKGVQDYLVKGQCEGGLAGRALVYAVERQRKDHELATRARQQAAVASLGRFALGHADAQEVLDEAVRQLTRTLGADLAKVLELRPDGRSLLLRAGAGWEPGDVGQDTVETGSDSQAGFTLLAGEPVVVTDFATERRFRAPPLLVRHGVVSGMSTVIAAPGLPHPYGVLGVHTRASRQFTEDDVHFLQAIANVVAVALERQRSEAALRDGAARLRAIVGTAVDAIVTIDDHGRIESVNPATERMFGYAAAELVGRDVNLLMPEPYHGEHGGYLRRYLRTGRPRIIGIGREVVGLREDGTTFPLDLSVSEFRLAGRRMFTGILHDATDRRRLEQQVIEASAAEQRRIGQDLHDGLCQELVGVAFAAKLLAGRLEGHAPDEASRVRELAGLVNGAISQARTLAHGLSPVELQGGDLAAALAALAARVSDLFQIECRCACDERVVLSDASAANHLYRIAQEAVSNAVKHGKARRVDVSLTATEARITLSIKDDGHGIPETLPESAGIGLTTMSYRARLVGGAFSIQPGPRKGTVVTCVLPRDLPGAAPADAAESRRHGHSGGDHRLPHASAKPVRPGSP